MKLKKLLNKIDLRLKNFNVMLTIHRRSVIFEKVKEDA
jgi:hypothetical protein